MVHLWCEVTEIFQPPIIGLTLRPVTTYIQLAARMINKTLKSGVSASSRPGDVYYLLSPLKDIKGKKLKLTAQKDSEFSYC